MPASRKQNSLLFAFTFCVLALTMGTVETAASTLQAVRDRAVLNCGVSEGLLGFSAPIEGKGWKGFDVDFCRALAVAVLGDADKVKYLPLSADQRFRALREGRIDILSRNTTWTMRRDVELELAFVGINYYDGQGFMVPRSAGLSSALQLENAKICALAGTTTLDNAKRFFNRHKLAADFVTFASRKKALESYQAGKCEAYTADRSALASQRVTMARPGNHILLPEVISKEPLGPVVRQDDMQWLEITQWVLFLLINAEERGWSSKAATGGSAHIPVPIVPEEVSRKLGLKTHWAVSVIRAVGNYGEIFERHLGSGGQLKIKRGANALWTRGGLLYAPPLR